MEQGELKEKVAIVTGSATGIGAAVAAGLAQRGAKVIVNYAKSEKEAKATAESVEAAGGTAKVVQGDVAKDEDCRKLVAAALESWGRIDILVNNAGTTKFVSHEDMDALSAEDFLSLYAVNVVGPFQLIRAARPALKAHGEGAVVNISSLAGIAGIGSSVAYAASKGALNTMTLSLARVLGPEIRVNAVCPGYVATRWFSDRFGQATTERISQDQVKQTPLQRAGQPEDIANAVFFFCGPLSRHITGEMLVVDAGFHLTQTRGR